MNLVLDNAVEVDLKTNEETRWARACVPCVLVFCGGVVVWRVSLCCSTHSTHTHAHTCAIQLGPYYAQGRQHQPVAAAATAGGAINCEHCNPLMRVWLSATQCHRTHGAIGQLHAQRASLCVILQQAVIKSYRTHATIRPPRDQACIAGLNIHRCCSSAGVLRRTGTNRVPP